MKNILITGTLFVAGLALGIYLDTTQKTYANQVIVRPNFNSVDYLYSKVNLLNSKIKKNDTVFLASIGLKNFKNISKIEVKPVVDVYRFVNYSERNFELLKLMGESGDLKKIVEDDFTSKNYEFHQIIFSTLDPITDKNTVDPIMSFLNDNDYFRQMQKESIKNMKIKIAANDTLIRQIDGVLKGMSDSGSKKDNSVYINENTQLNDIIETKDKLIREQGDSRIALIYMQETIKKCTSITNIEYNEALDGNFKIIMPLLFILIFAGVRAFRAFYRSQSLKLQEEA